MLHKYIKKDYNKYDLFGKEVPPQGDVKIPQCIALREYLGKCIFL